MYITNKGRKYNYIDTFSFIFCSFRCTNIELLLVAVQFYRNYFDLYVKSGRGGARECDATFGVGCGPQQE